MGNRHQDACSIYGVVACASIRVCALDSNHWGVLSCRVKSMGKHRTRGLSSFHDIKTSSLIFTSYFTTTPHFNCAAPYFTSTLR